MKHLVGAPVLCAAIVATAVLTGCGGGGDDNSVSTPPATNQSAGGIWEGQLATSGGVAVSGVALITQDGRLFSEAKNLNNGCADVTMGSVTVNGSTVTGNATVAIVSYSTSPGIATNCTYPDGSTSGTGTLSGSVVQGSTLTLTAHDTTANGTALPSGTVTLNYNGLYSEASSLSKIAGTWTTSTGTAFTISSDGSTFVQDPATGCVVNGQISIIDPNYNAYASTGTYANCQGNAAILNGITGKGILTLDDQVSPNELIAGTAITLSNGVVVIGIGDGTR